MTIIETAHLTLQQLTPEDASFILTLVNTPSWLRFIGDRGVHTLEDAHTYIQTGPMASYKTFGFGLWLIRTKEIPASIGLCGLLKREALEDPDIGFALLPEYEGKGYAFEAASAVVNYVREELKIKRIVAIVMEQNQKSVSLLGKLGMTFEKTVVLSSAGEELLLFSTNF